MWFVSGWFAFELLIERTSQQKTNNNVTMTSGHRSPQDCLFMDIVLTRVWRMPRANTVYIVLATKYASVGFELEGMPVGDNATK